MQELRDKLSNTENSFPPLLTRTQAVQTIDVRHGSKNVMDTFGFHVVSIVVLVEYGH